MLQAHAEKMKRVLAGVPGVADLGIVKSGEVPQVHLIPDRSALARFGLDVGRLPAHLPGGRWWCGRGGVLGRRNPTRRGLALRPGARDDLEKIRKLPVAVSGGVTVPLQALAEVRWESAVPRSIGKTANATSAFA